MKIFDSLSGGKKELEKTKKRINLFVCGLTVYDSPHIGNARVYVTFDAFVRYLRSRGYKLFYLQNITDIDDKIITRAKESGVTAKELADKYTKEYLTLMNHLGVTEVDKYVPATKLIPEIVEQVKALIEKGYAYKISDGYYFDISKFKEYGKLSRRSAEQAEQATSRIDESSEKRNRGDFCLWKFSKNQEPSWDTELGSGRPGWHIEDTAISDKYFGPQYDIHGGGIDLKFPHHEAEITQQEAISGKSPFVNIWMHTGMLFVDGVKMSKSLNNFVTIKDFLSKHKKDIFRIIILTHHYRSNINYTDELLKQANSSLDNIQEFLDKLEFVAYKSNKSLKKDSKKSVTELIKKTKEDFESSINNDFNTAGGMATIFTLITEINKSIWNISSADAKLLIKFITGLLSSLGLNLRPNKPGAMVKVMLSRRDKLRGNKQFIQSDALRKKIEELGYKVEDTPLGSFARQTNKGETLNPKS